MCICLGICMCAMCILKLSEARSFRSPGMRVTDGYEPFCGCSELILDPLQE